MSVSVMVNSVSESKSQKCPFSFRIKETKVARSQITITAQVQVNEKRKWKLLHPLHSPWQNGQNLEKDLLPATLSIVVYYLILYLTVLKTDYHAWSRPKKSDRTRTRMRTLSSDLPRTEPNNASCNYILCRIWILNMGDWKPYWIFQFLVIH